jgi:MoaA/NifB/PqqE/SkfB family radical SAM enzyme
MQWTRAGNGELPLPRGKAKSEVSNLLKRVSGQVFAFCLRLPALDRFVLAAVGEGLALARPVLRANPYRFITFYKAVRIAFETIRPGEPEKDTRPIARACRALDLQLERAIREYLASEPDPLRVRAINHKIVDYEADQRVERVKGFPYRIYIELTSACNLRCRMCTQSSLDVLTPLFLDLDRMESIEPALRYVELVSLVGFGETFLHRDFRAFFERVSRPGLATRIISNGILVDESLARFLVGKELGELWVSLDATTPETYRFVRGVDQFDRILSNIRRLNEIKRELGKTSPEISLTFVAMRQNIAELPNYVRLARELGAVGVHVCYVIVYDEPMREQSLFFDPETSNRYMSEARALAADYGLAFHGPAEFDPALMGACRREPAAGDAKGKGYRDCREPREFTYFNCAGKVVPCCTEYAQLGDLNEGASFEEIWNGAKYRAYRRSLSSDRPSKFCVHCMQVAYRGVNEPESHFRILSKTGELPE